MTLLVSFRHLYTDWYAGELYTRFFSYLKENYKHINFVYEDILTYGTQFGFSDEYSNGLPTPFSPYNLIITDPKKRKLFIHSFQDYAPVMITELLKIKDSFDNIRFCCCSNLTPHYLEPNKYGNIEVQPSFYGLENLSDYTYIEKYKNEIKTDERAFFAGLVYGERGFFKEIFNDTKAFNFLDKREASNYLNKDDYYKTLSRCLYGMSFNGAAKICYRDLEYFGLGVLNLREQLDICTIDPLIENIHYINFFDSKIKESMWNFNKKNEIIEQLEAKLHDLVFSGKKDYIIENANLWYKNNCTLESHIKWLDTFLNNFAIL